MAFNSKQNMRGNLVTAIGALTAIAAGGTAGNAEEIAQAFLNRFKRRCENAGEGHVFTELMQDAEEEKQRDKDRKTALVKERAKEKLQGKAAARDEFYAFNKLGFHAAAPTLLSTLDEA